MKHNQPISLFEYSNHTFDEPLTQRQSIALNRRCHDINTHAGRDVLTVRHNTVNQIVGLRSYQYVGVLQIDNSLTIQILPKMYESDGEQDATTQSIQNLLYMLNYCGKLVNPHDSSAHLRRFQGDFYEVLIHLYASSLLHEMRNSLHHEYVTMDQNLPYLRGKLLFNQHLLRNSVSQNRFFITTDEFLEDNPLNRVFAYASKQLLSATRNVKNRQLLLELDHILADVTPTKITYEYADSIKINRLNQRFAPSLELAKLFLSGSTLQLSSARFPTATFFIDMNSLFEDYIAKLVKQLAAPDQLVYTQGPREHLVVGSRSADSSDIVKNQMFQMKPDITIGSLETNAYSHIIDTKYKILEPTERKLGVSQSDMYQMYAYSRKYNVRDITLLYPELPDQPIDSTSHVLDDECTVHIRSVNLSRDLRSSVQEIRSELSEIFNIGKSSKISRH